MKITADTIVTNQGLNARKKSMRDMRGGVMEVGFFSPVAWWHNRIKLEAI